MNSVKLRHAKKYVNAGVFAGACFFIGEIGVASPLLNPADYLPEKAWFFSISGQSVKKEPVIKISNVNDVQISLTGGNTTIFSGSNVEIETETESEALVANFGFRPGEGFAYQFRVGQVRNFDLEFSSGSHSNRLDSSKDGFLWGLGLSGRINPSSIVSVGISWQLNFSKLTIDLDRFQSPNITASSNVRFQEEEYQGAVNFSHRWKKLEPYAGLKILRTVARMTDLSTKSRLRGESDGVSPFLGVQYGFSENESFAIETSFIDEKSLSASLKVQF